MPLNSNDAPAPDINCNATMHSHTIVAPQPKDVFFAGMTCRNGSASKYPPLALAERFAIEVVCPDLPIKAKLERFLQWPSVDESRGGDASGGIPPAPFGVHKPWAYSLDVRVFEAWQRELVRTLATPRPTGPGGAPSALAANEPHPANKGGRCIAGPVPATDLIQGI